MTRLSHWGDQMPTSTFHNISEDKKKRIINASLKEFAIHDFAHVNIQNIIKDARISRGSFYQYFADLEDLFGFLVDKITTLKKTYLNNLQMLHGDAPFLDRIGELYRLGYQFALENTLIYEAGKHMIKHATSSDNNTVIENKKWLKAYYKEEIQKDIDRHIIRSDVDMDMLIDLITLFLDELSESHYISQKLTQNEVDQRFKRFINLLKKGIDSHV